MRRLWPQPARLPQLCACSMLHASHMPCAACIELSYSAMPPPGLHAVPTFDWQVAYCWGCCPMLEPIGWCDSAWYAVLCFKCQRPGHMARDCPNRGKVREQRAQAVCLRCGKSSCSAAGAPDFRRRAHLLQAALFCKLRCACSLLSCSVHAELASVRFDQTAG